METRATNRRERIRWAKVAGEDVVNRRERKVRAAGSRHWDREGFRHAEGNGGAKRWASCMPEGEGSEAEDLDGARGVGRREASVAES